MKIHSFRARCAMGTAIAGLAMYGYGGRKAYAGDCVTNLGGTLCSGEADPATDATQNIADPVIVTSDGFGIDTRQTGGNAFGLVNGPGGNPDLVLVDDFEALIAGADSGIVAINNEGDASITTTGNVIGETADGISVANTPAAVGIAVSANDVAGAVNGINAANSGSGATSITATGSVLGKTGNGVYALNGPNGTDLSITVNDVEGGTYGVRAIQDGTGDLTITSAGAASSAGGAGISATTAASAGNLTVSVNDVSGSTYGISADHNGSGDLTITALGTIAGQERDAVEASVGAGGGNLTIAVRDVVAGTDDDVGGVASAIIAENDGAGAITITADGDITSFDASGVYATNNTNGTGISILVAGNVSARSTGLYITNDAAAAEMSITVAGDIASLNDSGVRARAFEGAQMIIDVGGDIRLGEFGTGVAARNEGAGDTLVTVSGDIIGGRRGVEAENSAGALAISVGGSIESEFWGVNAVHDGVGAALIAVVGDVSTVDNEGVYLSAGATATDATIEVGGNVSSAISTGVYARNNGTGAMSITVGGSVTGGEDGIYARSDIAGTDMTIVAEGVVGVGNRGLDARHGGSGDMSVTTTGDVSGGAAGMVVYNDGAGALTVAASGAVEGGDTGLAAVNSGTDMTIAAEGPVSGGQYGVIAANQGTGAMSVTTSGRVSGGVGGFYIIGGATGTDVTVTANGDVAGDISGIGVLNNGSGVTTVNIGGAVSGGEIGGVGVNGAENVVNISASGSIGALSDFAVAANGGAATINNAGTITGFVQTDAGDDAFVNSSPNSLNLRHFADADNDGVRETENVAVSDFGAGNDTFVNTGTIRLLTVEDQTGFSAATDDDAAPTAFGTSGVAAYTPLGHAPASLEAAGVEQAHLVNLESFAHSGVITMQDLETGGLRPVAGDVLVITAGATAGVSGGGVFRSEGGVLRLDAQLDDGVVDVSDVLVVDGAVLGAGATSVFIANAGGAGASTDVNDNGEVDEGEGVRVIEVLDANNSDPGAFTLGAPAIAGAYSYDLYHGAISGDWFLASSLAPSVAVYEVLPQTLFALNDVRTMRERIGNRVWRGADGAVRSDIGNAKAQTGVVWGRIEGLIRRDVESDVSDFNAGYDVDRWQLQTGFDKIALETEDGELVAGINAHFGEASLDLRTDLGGGGVDSTGYGFGLSATWYDADGFYIDGQAQFSWIDMDFESDTLGELGDGENGFAYAFSAEGGQRFELGGGWSVTPQSQLAYRSASMDDFIDPFGAEVSLDSANSLNARIGAALDHERESPNAENRRNLYAAANLYYEFLGESEIDVSGLSFTNREDRLTAELGVGASLRWGEGRYAAFGQVDAATSFENFGDTYDLKGTAGIRVSF